MTSLEVQAAPIAGAAQRTPRLKPKKKTWRQALRRHWQLYTLAVLPVAYFAIFRYIPMIGNVIAFRRYKPGGSILGDGHWTMLYVHRLLFDDPNFWKVFSNTVILGGLTLAFTFPLPIVLALMLNELRSQPFKRFVQSVSYLPHFFSIVVVVAMIGQFVSIDGIANNAVRAFGGTAIPFIQQADWFRQIFVTSEVWQTVGWGTILYLAALTTIDEQLYEAARIDGAGRWRQTWHVTLPGIRPMMITVLILNIGQFLNVSFEKVLLLLNPLNRQTGDIMATYAYRLFTSSPNLLSYGAAIQLFESVIGLVLILSANQIARRTVGTSLW